MLSDQILTKLSKFKIPEKRYIAQSSCLQKLGYSQEQIERIIIRWHSFNTVRALLDNHTNLTKILNTDQIVKIAVNEGASKSFKALLNLYNPINKLGFSQEQIVKIAANTGGSRSLAAVLRTYHKLKELGFDEKQITKIAEKRGGSKNLNILLHAYHELINFGFSIEQLVKLVAKDGGSKNVEIIRDNLGKIKSLGYSAKEIVNMNLHMRANRDNFLQILKKQELETYDIKQLDDFLEELDRVYGPIDNQPIIFSNKRTNTQPAKSVSNASKRLKIT